MRVIVVVVLMLISTSLVADPGKGQSRDDRRKARIERQHQRKQQPRDGRSRTEKQRDRNVLIVMMIGAGLIVKGMSGE